MTSFYPTPPPRPPLAPTWRPRYWWAPRRGVSATASMGLLTGLPGTLALAGQAVFWALWLAGQPVPEIPAALLTLWTDVALWLMLCGLCLLGQAWTLRRAREVVGRSLRPARPGVLPAGRMAEAAALTRQAALVCLVGAGGLTGAACVLFAVQPSAISVLAFALLPLAVLSLYTANRTWNTVDALIGAAGGADEAVPDRYALTAGWMREGAPW